MRVIACPCRQLTTSALRWLLSFRAALACSDVGKNLVLSHAFGRRYNLGQELMKLGSFLEQIKGTVSAYTGKKDEPAPPPTLGRAERFPYGPFRFEVQIARRANYEIQASADLHNWLPIAKGAAQGPTVEHVDSDASKFSYRFYRVLADAVLSTNVIGYATTTLSPGFSLIANPLSAAS